MRRPIHFANIVIDENSAPLVIAEIGINHGGSLTVAKSMVDSAYKTGVHCIKHQTHVIDDEMSKAARNVIPGNAKKSIYEIMASCALSRDDEYELMQYVESKGMVFLSTPFSRAAADRLQEFGVAAFKIGSGECNNHPLLRHVASFGKPMIVSTGMNDLESVKKTAAILDEAGVEYAFLHTTNLYPTDPRLVRLGAMLELAREFPHTLFGLSDHTLNNNACLAATALGASILERHFTDSKSRPGPDIICSMDSDELKALIKGSAEISLMRGGTKSQLAEEQITRDFAYATVVTIAPVCKGEIFSRKNIWVKRPGTGEIRAEDYDKLLGHAAVRDITIDEHLSWADVAGN
jgi:N-acetylneuraminate synthase